MFVRAFLLTLCSFSSINHALAAVAATSKPITPTITLTSIPEASKVLEAVYAKTPSASDLLPDYIKNGLTTLDETQAGELFESPLTGPSSDKNVHKKNPSPPIYPKAEEGDAPYSLTEDELRAALYIPHTFQCGSQAQPIILVPGTGSIGYLSFVGSYIPLLQGSTIADPVWLNIPGFLLGDAQINAEYVAYSINYISALCHCPVAVAAWSQGNIDAQWAYKYWPSTRSHVTDHIGFSPDYHGSTFSSSAGKAPPATLQQAYDSTFITTLRSKGGDAAYVPTTTIYSAYDEIVQPQSGKNASAYLLTSPEAEASNNEVQVVCAGMPAGSLYTHEGIMYNPLGFALLQDALSHDGPGQASRLDLGEVCGTYTSPGLTVYDFRLTEDTIVVAGVAENLYPDQVSSEPAIKPYTDGDIAYAKKS